MKLNRTGAFAAGVVATLVIGSGTAVAANGKSLLLGRSNTATAVTSVTNSKGTALSLRSKKGTPPLAVNNSTRVPNLNADRLDGYSSGSFLKAKAKAADADKVDGINGASIALVGGQTGVVWGSNKDADRFVDTANCPSGTKMLSGGGVAPSGETVLYDGPDHDLDTGVLIPNSWYVDTTSADIPALTYVMCYNPRGAVPGAAKSLPMNAPTAPLGAASMPKRSSAHR
jgi:hypothetical protein